MPRPSPLRTLALAAGLALAWGCARDLSLPSRGAVPAIEAVEPSAAYADERIFIRGRNFDPAKENNTVVFPDGFQSLADEVTPDGIWAYVNFNTRVTGRLVVRTAVGSSAPAPKDFTPLGYGRPIQGNLIAELRFRHRPVGLVNRAAVVLVASTLFDAVVDDAGAFTWVDGRPSAFVRSREVGLAFLALEGADGGELQQFDVDGGEVRSQSAASPYVERFILPAPPPPASAAFPVVARSLGVDGRGSWALAVWTRSKAADGTESLSATRSLVDAADIVGAATWKETTAIVTTSLEGGRTVQRLQLVADDGSLTPIWTADPAQPALPAGPVVLTHPSGNQDLAPTTAVLGLTDGDLATIPLDGTPWQRTRMISFNPAVAMANSYLPGKVLLSKPGDGALFQFDVVTREIDWVVQLRGEPTWIDVAPDLDEIAVANSEDNFVDVVQASTGVWQGRSSLSLGLGSSDFGDGGLVAPYSYDPDLNGTRPQVIHILARTAPMVMSMEPNALNLLGQRLLDPTSPPMRLVLTQDLATMVVHESLLGLLETKDGDEGDEVIVTDEPLPEKPLAVDFLRDGRVLVASLPGVDVYGWDAQKKLRKQGSLQLPAGAVVTGMVSHRARFPGRTELGDGGKDWLLVSWRSGTGLGAAYYTVPASFTGAVAPDRTVTLAKDASEQIGTFDLRDGPALLFARSSLPGPLLATHASLQGTEDPQTGLATGPQVTRATPDGRYVVWTNQGPGEHVIRLLSYDYFERKYGLQPYSGYRFDGRPSGPGLDPSGEWLYVPVPRTDTISVQQ